MVEQNLTINPKGDLLSVIVSGGNHFIADERVEDLRRRLLAAVRRSCPAWLSSQVEDITQEALIKIVGIIQRTGETNRVLPASYINKVAYHATVDAMRRNRRQGSKEVSMQEEAEFPIVEKMLIDPERTAISGRIKKGIQQCLGTIVASRNEAVVLHLQGHSVPEIGELMGWTGTKTTNLVYRGLKDLRKCLVKKGLSP
ncbi:MAG: RNA polymerase sigma factor [Deltaproteobacteria bacterium]|nr:RNA polymerase sigma factor [Deltaproteobacteria bacterium]